MATVGSLAWQLLANSTGFGAGTKAAIKDTRALRGELSSLKGVASGLSSTLGALGVAFSGAAVVAGLGAMVNTSREAIESVANLSERLGVTTEKLVGLQHAAQLSGSDASSLADNLDSLSKSLGSMELRAGKNAELLTKLGLNAEHLASIRVDEAFLEIADAMAAMDGAQQRSALAGLLKISPDMVNVLSQGRSQLEGMANEAERLGIAFSRADAERVKEANDAWDRMKASVQGVSTEITIALAPAIENLANNLSDLANIGRIIRGDDLHPTPGPGLGPGVMFSRGRGIMPPSPSAVEQSTKADDAAAIREQKELQRQEEASLKQAESVARAEADARKAETDSLMDLADSIKTPAQRLTDEFSNILDISRTGAGFENPDVIRGGLEDLAGRIREQLGFSGPVGQQSTAAIRAGSIESIRAQFSGGVAQKQLKEAEKQTREQESMRGLLETISEKIQGLAEAPG